jgi:tripartite-type tricarboxylate transporter receptor subunit TctC
MSGETAMHKHLVAALLLTSLAALAPPAQAQAWPGKPIRLIVAYPAGGGLDFVARAVSQRLAERLKTPVVVENRSGASGSIGADLVAKSPPDGYTLLMASPAEIVVGPAAGQKIPYKPETDLVPVTLAGETPLVLAVNPSVPGTDLASFIASAKANPGKLTYGTPGNGSSMQFAGEAFKGGAGISMEHVPYRGAAPALNDALGGQISMVITGMPPVVPQAKSGKLRVLAVTTAKRSLLMPEVPAVAELPGMKDYRFSNWMMVFAAARTPPPIVDRLNREIAAIVAEPAVKERLEGAGVEPLGLGGKELAAFLADERRRYGQVAKERSIHFEE